MRWKFLPNLNIRQKVIVGFALCMLVIGLVGGISYHYLVEIERKQHFVEVADDLSNIILEVRRYEKNYLLYGSREDLIENRRYLDQGMELLQKISPEMESLKGAPLLNSIAQEFLAYHDVITQLAADEHPNTVDAALVNEQLRERGKALVDFSQDLVSFERKRILNIIRTLKAQLLLSLSAFLVLGGFLITIVAQKIIRPLRVIEKTTVRIASGDFRPIPVLETHDETQTVVEAFNRMVAELIKRQDQLLQTKKLASLGTLTSGVAHQLNNPLNNISTSCQILLEELALEEGDLARRMLMNIEQEVHRARDIVRGLLEFSRVREFCLAPTSLAQIVDRSVALMSSQIPPGIEIIKEIPQNLSLNLDAQRMQQVFLNLIENAVHAIAPPGQIKITARQALDTNEVIITVQDTGVGIAQHEIGRIFDPFFTSKEVGIGTGLGLSIAYGIIQKHHGSISVQSEEGKGTQFIIRFPHEAVCRGA
ncbi:ATP-binding protein [Desulfoferrobacter suflitae]|uniref:ATP-binding protein n=1 Tax=Desulfoferrobacter suflitae TaxID=2865782 RepID=UPI00216422D4|nr:ATP-binding protein [Desulfoferrobacter suflitae]MCK8603533.1 ATP-binding protein [Desulfoferrobacter suflitae]